MSSPYFRILALVGTLAFFLPFAVLTARKLWSERSFLLFTLYWLVTGLANLTDYIGQMPAETREAINIVYNLLDIPFLLSILLSISDTRVKRIYLAVCLSAYVLVGAYALGQYGFGYEALKYPMGAGLLFVILFVGWEIKSLLGNLRHTRRQRTMLFIFAALLFQFGTFVIIYFFDYFVPNRSREYNFLFYYISSIVALSIALCGLAARGLTRVIQ